ncbi:MAG TPA: hypothetical protein VH934_03245 [Xanthobacteraceae bacterium]
MIVESDWGVMVRRLLPLGFVGLGILAAMIMSAAAQPVLGEAGRVIGAANALSSRIAGYHRGPGRWLGLTPVPPSYCATMREGEAVMKELARLASRAILYRLPGLALQLQAAGNRLGDELDEEEIINQVAGIPYTVYPCPVPGRPYPTRAPVLVAAERRMPSCRREADALGVSFAARRTLVQQCLR